MTVGPMLFGDYFDGVLSVAAVHDTLGQIHFESATGFMLHGILAPPFWLAMAGLGSDLVHLYASARDRAQSGDPVRLGAFHSRSSNTVSTSSTRRCLPVAASCWVRRCGSSVTARVIDSLAVNRVGAFGRLAGVDRALHPERDAVSLRNGDHHRTVGAAGLVCAAEVLDGDHWGHPVGCGVGRHGHPPTVSTTGPR